MDTYMALFYPPLSLGKEKEEGKRRIKNGMAFFYLFLQKTFITLFLPFIVLFPDCRVLAGGDENFLTVFKPQIPF